MTRHTPLLLFLLLLGLVSPAIPQAMPPAELPVSLDESPDLWFVELMSPPAADGTSLATLRKEKDAFRLAARRAGVQFTERYAFDTLWNGLSVRVAKSQLGALARVPGVKALYPVASIPRPVTSVLEPDLATALVLSLIHI